jgi:hypothetical protein
MSFEEHMTAYYHTRKSAGSVKIKVKYWEAVSGRNRTRTFLTQV